MSVNNKPYIQWTPEEDKFLLENYPTKGPTWCFQNIPSNRTLFSIQYRARTILHLNANPSWSQEQISFLKENYGILNAKTISEKINKPINCVRIMAHKLKINCVNYKTWTENEIESLKKIYPSASKKDVISYFYPRKWVNIVSQAKKLNIKRNTKGMDKIIGDVTPLLNESNLSAYWLGFLLADGYFSQNNRMSLSLAAIDKEHVIKFAKFVKSKASLAKTGPKSQDQYKVSIMDNYNVLKIKQKYDISHNKTHIPPKLEIFENMSDNFFLSFLIGFIDGDGAIAHRNITPVKLLQIKVHASWLPVLNLFVTRLSEISKVQIPLGKLNNKGYARIMLSNNIHLKFLKNKGIEFNLPVLGRKWDKIDLNYISKAERPWLLKDQMIELHKNGWSIYKISKKLNTCHSTVIKYIKNTE